MIPLLANLRALKWVIGLFAIGALVLAWQIEKRQADKLERQLVQCSEGRKADRRAYEDAQKAAAEKNRAAVNQIVAEQERTNEVSERDTIARLERLRRELRAQTGAPSSSAGGTKAGPNGPPSANPDGASRLCPSPEELLRAAENEERHDQLITWVDEQLKIRR